VTGRPIRIGTATIREHRHVCAFFHSRNEEYGVTLPFIAEGVALGERSVHVIDPEGRADHLSRLGGAGIDVPRALERGQLEVLPWDEAYLRDGVFDPDRMLALIEETLTRGSTLGFPLTRYVAQMEWAMQGPVGVNDLVAYEARLNTVLSRFPDPVICTYDCAKFGAGMILDILRTHPAVLIGEVFHENPFYVPPQQLLEELGRRGDDSAPDGPRP